MKPKFCLPIIKTNKADVLKTIQKNIKDFDYFEVWVDHVNDVDVQFIKKLINLLKGKLIIVFRRNDLNDMKINFDMRFKLIKLLDNQPAVLDLDIKQEREFNIIKDNNMNISLIASIHDYNKTPSDEEIFKIIKIMSKNKPKIFKIATFCQSEVDALKLLDILLNLKKEGKKCIVIGMGKFGLITRVFGTLWGNEMIYTPNTITEQSASGQLTKNQLITIFNILE